MRPIWHMLRAEPNARLFFIAHAQSSLGSGAGYVGLLVLAYDRLSSPWAITLVLLADFLPAMLFGPLFGAAADRWSRRTCAVVADVVRAIAFLGIGTVDGFGATVGFALLAGAGTALFKPAVLAAIPGVVEPGRLAPANSLYGALEDAGWTLGPALAAGVFVFAGPEALMIGNAATFAVSAALLTRLSVRRTAADAEEQTPGSLLASAVAGLRHAARAPGVRILLAASAVTVLVSAMINLGELLLAEEALDAGETGFAVLVAIYGGFVAVGSLAGSAGGDLARQRRRYLAGLLLLGLGTTCSGLAPAFAVAAVTFAVTGFGDGLNGVYERLMLQTAVPDRLLGRVFSARDTFNSWGFAAALLGSAAIAQVLGPRGIFLVAGAGALLVWGIVSVALRRDWRAVESA